jgi:hypothetical protein
LSRDRGQPLFGLLVTVSLAVVSACDEDDPTPAASHGPRLEGPYRESQLPKKAGNPGDWPKPASDLGVREQAHFLWSHPKAAEGTLRVELVAEAAPPIELGNTVHVEKHEIAEDTQHGRLSVHPRAFSEGGARTGDRGKPEWVPGMYRLVVFRDGKQWSEVVFRIHEDGAGS